MMLPARHTSPTEVCAAAPARTRTGAPGGRALDADVQARMQSRFGQNFADVRVHTDAAAARAAAALGTRAYAHGEDIVFGAGHYAPATPAGQRLLAHELAHVAQQRHGADFGAGSSEMRAERAAQRVVRGDAVAPAALGGAAVGVHGDGKEGKKDDTTPKKDLPAPTTKPVFVPLTLFPLPALQAPSLLAPLQRQPLIPIPQLSLHAPPPAFPMQMPNLTTPPGIVPGAAPPGPLAPGTQPLTLPTPPANGAGAATPDLPSRIGVAEAGKISFGLRLGLPGPESPVPGTPPERRPEPPFAILGSGPSGLAVSEYQAELLDMRLTGKVPTGFDAIDKGQLAKIVFSIASTYIAPDFFKNLATKVAGKPGADYHLDLALTGDFKGAGIVFEMPLGKPPKVVPRSDGP